MGIKITAIVMFIIVAIYTIRLFINTPYDWAILLGLITFLPIFIPDAALDRFWALFKWTWLK